MSAGNSPSLASHYWLPFVALSYEIWKTGKVPRKPYARLLLVRN